MTDIPDKEFLNLILEIGNLKKVVRTGWALKDIKNPESVADHSFRVAIIAMILAPQLKLDQTKLIKMALVHDLGEAAIGDIVWEKGGRIIASQSEKHKDEQKAVQSMFSDNPSFREYIALWEEFEKQVSPEAKIIKQIDKLEMVIQAYEYESEGYINLDEFWQNVEKYLNNQKLETYFIELKKLRKEK